MVLANGQRRGSFPLRTFVCGAAIVAAAGCNPADGARGSQTSQRVVAQANAEGAYVRMPSALLSRELIKRTGFNRDHLRDDEYAFGYMPRAGLDALPNDLSRDIVELDAQAWAAQRFDTKTLRPLERAIELEDDEPIEREGYHNYAALTSELEALRDAHSDIATLETIGQSDAGRELWMLKISDDASANESEPKLLYIANMHGDEVVGRELMIYLARKLLNEYDANPRIKRLVDNAQIYIIPSMNPDGFELGRRSNNNGVDLNRDFPDFTADPVDTAAGRQPETAAIMALHDRHHFEFALNFHGGEVCFNVPWDTQPNDTTARRFGDDALMRSVGRAYADANATMRANSGGSFDRGLTYGYEWYEVDGGMQDWSIHYRNSTHATVELSYTKWPQASTLAGAWRENEEALVAYLEQGTLGVHLDVRDVNGAPVIGATVRGGGATNGRGVPYAFDSVVHRTMLPGPTSVTVSAPGYMPQTVSLTPWRYADDARIVTLTP